MNDKITKALETVNELHGETLKKLDDTNTICHDVDLLGDWLDAKGYTEEAGLCLRVLGLIHAQAREIEKLRDALKPITDIGLTEARKVGLWSPKSVITMYVNYENLSAAVAALKETEHD